MMKKEDRTMWKKLTTLTFAILMCGGLQLAASGPDTGKAEEIIANMYAPEAVSKPGPRSRP